MTFPLYLVRHGESDWNVLGLTQGQADVPRLTARGRAQARAAAETIRADVLARGVTVAVVRTSDLQRAVQTATILADVLGAPVVHDERLREQHLGALEGRPYSETWAAAERHDWSDPDRAVGGGESPRRLRARLAAALDAVAPSGATVLVSHGEAARAAVAHLSGVDPRHPTWVDVPNGAVLRVADGGLPLMLTPPGHRTGSTAGPEGPATTCARAP